MNIEIFDIVMIGLIIILIETWYLCIKVKNMLDKNHDQLLCFMWGHVFDYATKAHVQEYYYGGVSRFGKNAIVKKCKFCNAREP